MSPSELIIDSFAGGGGASLGIELALGRSPDVAINHDAEAIALHRANHPGSRHYQEDVWKVDPHEATGGRPVGLMWLSPDCKHFSKAKGGKPVSPRVRGLAWVAVRWAKAVRPRVIVLENVEEFQTWGPLGADGRPCPERKGRTFRMFCGRLRGLGYEVQHQELRACDYGAPTSRKRLFLIARCDGQPIVWPKPTHGRGRALPWRSAAECIDWSIPCPSIFLTKQEGRAIGAKRPLAEATLRRIARGVQRYVLDSPKPFIVQIQNASASDAPMSIDAPLRTVTAHPKGGGFALATPYLVEYHAAKRDGDDRTQPLGGPLPTQTTENRFALAAPVLVPRYGEREGQAPRAVRIDAPMPTIVPTQNGGQLVAAFMAQHNTDVIGHAMTEPVSTIVQKGCTQALVTGDLFPATSTWPGRAAEVSAFLVAYYGNEKEGGDLFSPMRTVTSRERFALVTVDGAEYVIADIGMRMLAARELYRAQGFSDTYRIDIEFNGKPLTKTAQVRMCGNSVCPPLAAAIVAANVGTPALEAVA
jgi:DNA (cytosine-5)-methyltransferase 1